MSQILKIENLTKTYGAINAVDNLNLSINKGDVFGILGPNGSGKTTTLSIILGVITQTSGNFYWQNNEANELINSKVGALLEQPNFYPYLSLVDNLKIVSEIKKIENASSEIDRVLKTVNLHERKLSKFKEMSLGMKQRLALASLLLGNPDILILDEPTNGLDPKGIAEVRDIIIAEAEKSKTIILASHILDEVEKVCSKVAILQKGNLIKQGEISEITKSSEIIILSADNINALYDELVRSGMYEKIDKTETEIHIVLNNKYKSADINKFAFEKGFVLSKFETQKQTLEAEFLKLLS